MVISYICENCTCYTDFNAQIFKTFFDSIISNFKFGYLISVYDPMNANSALQLRGWPLNNRMLAMAAAFGLGGALLYWFYHCRKSNRTDSKSMSILSEAEHIKACGVESYRHKKFEEAIHLFGAAIDELQKINANFSGQVDEVKIEELMSLCENNKAACYDELGNTEECLVHCDLALQIKPNYEKAIRRRARSHFKLGHKDIALNDYLDLTCLENVSKESLTTYHIELDRVAEAIIVPLLNETIQNRIGQTMKIPQMMVNEWMLSTVNNDPLLVRMAKLMDNLNRDEAQWVSPLDEVLFALKRGEYDGIASLAIPIVDDETSDPVDRMLAVLLAARFLAYQTLKKQATELAQKFDSFWDKLDEAQKLAHKDVHVAYITLQLFLIDLTENDSLSNEENFKVDETVKQRCHQLVEEGLRINPKNVDPLVTFGVRLIHVDQHDDALSVFQKAKKLDQKNPFVRFYEIHARLTLGIRQQSFIDIQNQMFMMQQILTEWEGVPIFAFILLSKFAILLHNNQLVIEACKKVLEKMPNCSYAIYLLGLVDVSERAGLSNFVQSMERAMRKAIEADPNNWEPYRIMGKICADRKSFTEAFDFFSKAISLARKRDELMVLFKERLMTNAFAKRIEQGKDLPLGMTMKTI